jgi:hypothetical protein
VVRASGAPRCQSRFSAIVGYLPYHDIRRTPSTTSKCESRLTNDRLCCRNNAAIQISLSGRGRPFCFNSKRIWA